MKLNSLFVAILCTLSLSTSPVSAKESVKKPRVVHICKKNDTAVNILACNMYREARGESDYGMMAVGFVTLNRKDHDKFPQSVKKIVYQSHQFSWTLAGTSFKVTEQDRWEKAKAFSKTLVRLHTHNKIAYDALDFTRGAVYFHAKSVNPYWKKHFVWTVTIDNHLFYKDKA